MTSKKLPNVYKSCPKVISLEKWKILTPLQKLTKNVGNLAKIILAACSEKLPKMQYTAQSGHTGQTTAISLIKQMEYIKLKPWACFWTNSGQDAKIRNLVVMKAWPTCHSMGQTINALNSLARLLIISNGLDSNQRLNGSCIHKVKSLSP